MIRFRHLFICFYSFLYKSYSYASTAIFIETLILLRQKKLLEVKIRQFSLKKTLLKHLDIL